jgi:hypothetical protein
MKTFSISSSFLNGNKGNRSCPFFILPFTLIEDDVIFSLLQRSSSSILVDDGEGVLELIKGLQQF